EAAGRVPRVRRRLDRAVARPDGPSFRRPGIQRQRPQDAAERNLPKELLDLVRAGRREPQGARRLYRPAQDHVGDRLPASRRLLPRRAGDGAEDARRNVDRNPPPGDGRRCDGFLRTSLRRGQMTRTYNVVDADGHILEPLNLWTDYIE